MNPAFLLSIAPRVDFSPFMTAKELNAAVGNNVGNLAFVHAIDTHLGGNMPRHRRLTDPETINAMAGTAVLPCANHLGAHIDLVREAAHFDKFTRPMVAIGLGAQSNAKMDLPDLSEGSQHWIRVLAQRAPGSGPNISVRGEFTLRLLDKYGLADHAVALGCPTLFLNPKPGLGQQVAANVRPIRRVAVAAGHYRWSHLYKLEASLAKIVSDTHGAYIIQSPLEMLQLSRGEAHTLASDVLEQARKSILPDGTIDEMVDWYRQHAIAFFNIPAWMDYLRSFDFVVGPRIHGIMLALQAGVPGLCIGHDSRTIELCQTMKVPYVPATAVPNGVTLEDLPRLFESTFDPVAFDRNREDLAQRYKSFLAGNGLQVQHIPV